MKEQWKKLDSDAKLLLNVEEGRSLPIKIELPLSAISQNKDDCCKRLLITLRVFVLLALLVLLSWTAMTLYTNYRMKSSVVIQNDEIPTYFNEANKMSFKNKIWEEDMKNAAINDVPVSEDIQEKTIKKSVSFQPEHTSTAYKFESPAVDSKNVDSFFKSEAESAESEQKSVDQLLRDLQDLVEKIEKEEEVSENIVKEEVDLINVQEDQNEKEALPYLSFLDSLVDQIFMSQLGQQLQESAEKTEEEGASDNIVKEETNLSELQKDANVEEDSESMPIQNWLDILGINQMFTSGSGNNEMQTNLHEFSEDSEEAAKEDIDRILMQAVKENQDALDQFLTKIMEGIVKDENDPIAEVSVESIEKNKQSKEKMSVNSQSSSEDKSLVNSVENPENNYQKPTSEETNDNNHNTEDFSMSLSDLNIFENPTIIPNADESTNQSSEELNKTDENNDQSVEVPFHSVVLKDIYLLMASRLEAMLGEYDDLLIWYFRYRNKPEPLDDAGQLKYFTTRLLFGQDITEFRKYSIFVLSFLMNDDYTKDFNRLVDPLQPKLKTETETQILIVNRLVTKSHMSDLYNQGDENAEEIADVIESINLLELKLSGVDVDTFLNSLEENKHIEEIVKEEGSVEEITDEAKKRDQAIIEAMRRVAHFDESLIDDSKQNDLKESKESNASMASFAKIPVQESFEETDNRRQAFIQAMQRIANISKSKEFSEEVDKNSDQSVKEDEEESSPEMISEESEEPIIEEVKSDSPEVSVQESSEEAANRRQAFVQALQRIADITEAEKSSEETEKNSDQSMKEDEKESSLQTISKESEEIPSWEPVFTLQSISEEEPIVEEIKSDVQSEVDVTEDELTKRLHSFMEDVLNSRDESEESVNMNDFLTVYDGFDY